MYNFYAALVNNLKSCSPPMYKFYLHLKSRKPSDPISENEANMASGNLKLTAEETSAYFRKEREKGGESMNLLSDAFDRQTASAAVCILIFPIGPILIQFYCRAHGTRTTSKI